MSTPRKANAYGGRLVNFFEYDACEWQERAACRGTDPEIFHPEKGGSPAAAQRICARCDVREECLLYALKHDERFGIWGGLSENDRRKLRRKARQQVTA